MRPQPTQFMVTQVNVNQNDFLSSFTDHNMLTAHLPGLRIVADLTELPMPKIMTALSDHTNYRSPFLELMDREGTTTTIDEEYFTYKMRNDGMNYIIAVQDLNEDTECPGLAGEPFPVLLGDATLKYGDVIAPANEKMYALRIVSPRGEPGGSGTYYNVEYRTGNDGDFYPKDLLKANVKWEKLFHAVGEATSLRGSFKSTMTKGWIQYGGNLTTLSKSVTVTDKATAQYLRFDFTNGGNPMIKQDLPEKVISFIEAEFITQTRKEEETYYLWGTANSAPLTASKAVDESSSYHVNIGSGFFQHASYGNIRQYIPKRFDTEQLANELFTIGDQRIRYEDWNWLILGGRRFVQMVMADMKKKYNLAAFMTKFGDMTEAAPAIDTANRTGVAFPTKQFTKLNFDPYGSITIGHWKELDSYQFLGPDMKYDGSPLASWWGFCLNIGLRGSSKKNIERIVKRNSEMFAYVCGTWTPRGPIDNLDATTRSLYNVASHRGAKYDLEWQKTVGFSMRDVNNMMWWVPNIGA